MIDIADVLKKHRAWLVGKGGARANLNGANLSGANLRRANLSAADLGWANLNEADLSSANLSGANLRRADLSGANLSAADLSAADLGWANLSSANLGWANLNGANLGSADLSGATLNGANLRRADLSRANLSAANLSAANLRRANLSGADLSGAKGLLDPVDCLAEYFEKTPDGYVVYKTFGLDYPSPDSWQQRPGVVLTEVVNPCRTDDCACGINVATREWIRNAYGPGVTVWKCLIRWEWLPGVVVPYNTQGKIRTSRLELLEVIKEETK